MNVGTAVILRGAPANVHTVGVVTSIAPSGRMHVVFFNGSVARISAMNCYEVRDSNAADVRLDMSGRLWLAKGLGYGVGSVMGSSIAVAMPYTRSYEDSDWGLSQSSVIAAERFDEADNWFGSVGTVVRAFGNAPGADTVGVVRRKHYAGGVDVVTFDGVERTFCRYASLDVDDTSISGCVVTHVSEADLNRIGIVTGRSQVSPVSNHVRWLTSRGRTHGTFVSDGHLRLFANSPECSTLLSPYFGPFLMVDRPAEGIPVEVISGEVREGEEC